jgi:metal-responsive CopG/Arc/MetJ family transcriptional regulator
MINKYQGVSLPKRLLDLIDSKKEEFGFTSKTDFIKQAIRHELERISQGEL